MTTENQVNDQLQKDYEAFYNASFQGLLPSNIIKYFEKALMAISPNLHQVHTNKIREVIKKRPEDLSTLEVGIVINIILLVPFKDLYDDLEEALTIHSGIESLKISFNVAVDELNKKLEKKKKFLMKLSGVQPNTVQFPPLKKADA